MGKRRKPGKILGIELTGDQMLAVKWYRNMSSGISDYKLLEALQRDGTISKDLEIPKPGKKDTVVNPPPPPNYPDPWAEDKWTVAKLDAYIEEHELEVAINLKKADKILAIQEALKAKD